MPLSVNHRVGLYVNVRDHHLRQFKSEQVDDSLVSELKFDDFILVYDEALSAYALAKQESDRFKDDFTCQKTNRLRNAYNIVREDLMRAIGAA